jgi:hypothetical protein
VRRTGESEGDDGQKPHHDLSPERNDGTEAKASASTQAAHATTA